jgi:hypothetical protein
MCIITVLGGQRALDQLGKDEFWTLKAVHVLIRKPGGMVYLVEKGGMPFE